MRWLFTGLLSAAAALAWQGLVVHFEYQGNWTGLFCTAAGAPQPPALAAENIYTFANSSGYDGQFYHYIAHDPFLRHGFADYVDAPRLRYRRILVPLAAYGLALGRSGGIDAAYIAVILASVFLGAYWLSALSSLYGFSPWWGCGFLLISGVLISIDRLTVDVALLALCLAAPLYFTRQAPLRLYGVLLAAALVRETGLLLVAGAVLYLALRRRWRAAALFSTAAIPAAAWYIFTALYTASPGGPRLVSLVPFSSFIWRVLNPVPYALPAPEAFAATVLDYAALAGVALAILLGYAGIRRLRSTPVATTLLLFALLATFLGIRLVWQDAYGFGRVFAPLALFAALDGARRNRWLSLLPLALMLPRTALQFVPHVLAIQRGLGGG